MTIIIIRHADDDSSNQKYKHDQKITKQGKYKSKDLSKKLIKKYGSPDEIVYGPMIRTKQTALAMLSQVKSTVTLRRDNRISRFFNSSEQRNPSVSTVTIGDNIPIKETKEEFYNRCKAFTREKIKPYMKSNKVLWVVTHTLVIKNVFKILNKECDDHLPFLIYYVIN